MINIKEWEQAVKDSTPGRFEGEPPETAYYYDMAMNGDGESFLLDDKEYSIFDVTEEEKNTFQIKNKYFVVYSSDQGFICGQEWSQEDYDYNTELENQAEEN
jgi:hypothetical protein